MSQTRFAYFISHLGAKTHFFFSKICEIITNKPCSPKRLILKVWYFESFKMFYKINLVCSLVPGCYEIFWGKIIRFVEKSLKIGKIV
jgi:hypothetical protein